MINKKGRFSIKLNSQWILRDKNGKIKPLFQLNDLGAKLLKLGKIDAFNTNPEYGSFQDSMLVSNLITTVGFAGMASRCNGDGAEAAFTYIAVGTGTTAANVADTTLETETAASGLSRAAATASRVTTDGANDTARLVKTFTVTGTVAITESGVLNASSAGTLLSRQVFSAVNVVNGDSLQVTWDFDFD